MSRKTHNVEVIPLDTLNQTAAPSLYSITTSLIHRLSCCYVTFNDLFRQQDILVACMQETKLTSN